MKEYLRYFGIPFALVGILAVVTLVAAVMANTEIKEASASTNTERTTTERVFDYADKLTDEEEDSLRELISRTEKETQCDIVLVTLNESLVEYAAQYEAQIGSVPISKCVMVYADNFYDEHKFGYEEPYGDGVLLLDNWYRESDGWVYNWFTTSGRAEARYTNAMIGNVIDEVNDIIKEEDDPYEAYVSYVKNVRRDMTGSNLSSGMEDLAMILQPHYILIAAVVIALIFLLINWSSKKGKRTTTNRTYVVGGNPVFRRREDRFLHKNVTKHKIESSSGSGGGGGGGHHRSSSGRSHGGGGGRR